MARACLVLVIAWGLAGCTTAGAEPRDAGMDAFVVPDAVWWFPDAPFIVDVATDGPPIGFGDETPLIDFFDADHFIDAGRCIDRCASDEDCGRTCPFSAGSSACCDAATHACYFALACPQPFIDGGLDAAADAACSSMPSGVQITVDMPSLPGANVRFVDSLAGVIQQTTLDAAGHGTLSLTEVGVMIDASGRSRLVDVGTGQPLGFAVSAGTDLQLTLTTQIAGVHDGLVSELAIVVRRDPTTAACVPSVVSATQDCVARPGRYDPTRFDDQPCGPFR